MINAWSLLYEELKMSENFETRYEDSIPKDTVTHSKYYYDKDRNKEYKNWDLTNGSQDFWNYDGGSMVGNPMGAESSSDTINFSSDIVAAAPVPMIFGAEGEDHISFDLTEPSNPPTTSRRKYSEDVIIKELQDYITRTYDQHYSAGDDKIQTLDLIEACGDGEAFCRSNILKYASRYDKKGTARRDIMKILHYAVLLMHFNDKNAKRETYPQ
jgi:hypothetical protein